MAESSLPASVHTPAHSNCAACDAARQRALTMFNPGMLFEEAAEAYYSHRKSDLVTSRVAYCKPNTLAAYRRQIEALKLFFHGMPLQDIHWWHMRSYQDARATGSDPFLRYRRPQDAKPRKLPRGIVLPPVGKTPCPAKPQQINQETGFLKRLKVFTGCWTPDDQRYYSKLIEEESDKERALTPEQQVLWLETARSRPRWNLVWLYSLVAFDTLASPNELRMLRFGNINLHWKMISVPWAAAKNPYRKRDIVIADPSTLEALNQLINRARSLGAGDPAMNPMHCLFPIGVEKGVYNPEEPMTSSGLKKPWQEVREATGFKEFRIEDTRHTGATRLAEAGVPADVICTRMGHSRPEQRLHYTHISQSAQRDWLRKPPLSVHQAAQQQNVYSSDNYVGEIFRRQRFSA